MTLFMEYSFSKARSNLTEVIDNVQRLVPVVIKPRKRSEDASVVVSRSLMLRLLRECGGAIRVSPHFVSEPDASVTLSLEPLDIVVNSKTREEAIRMAAEETIEYAKEYLAAENVMLYSRSPNRKAHLPFVIRIAMCESASEIAEALGLA